MKKHIWILLWWLSDTSWRTCCRLDTCYLSWCAALWAQQSELSAECSCTVDTASWLSGFSSVLLRLRLLRFCSDERLLIDISQLSVSQFKEMVDRAAHSRSWSLLLAALCWWDRSAPILSLEDSRHPSKGSLLKLWGYLRHKHKTFIFQN